MSNLWQGLGNKLIGSLHGSEAIEVRKAWCENSGGPVESLR